MDWRLGEHDVGGGHGEAVHVARARGGHLAQQRAGDGRGVGAACGGGVESSRRGVELRDRGRRVDRRVIDYVHGLRAKANSDVVPETGEL